MISKKKAETPLSMIIPESYSLRVQGITQSLISSFLQCRQKFVYAINRMSSPKKAERTLFGNIVHFALSILYKQKNFSIAMLSQAITDYRALNQIELSALDKKKVERDFAVAEVVMTAYLSFYCKDWTEMKDREPEKEVEVTLHNEDGSGHAICKCRCKIDGRYRDKSKAKWLLETKTKGRISEESLVKRLAFDPQNLFYLMCDRLDTGEEAAGVLYNIIRNPQIKQKQDETMQQFCERLRADIKLRPEFYFIRFEIPYTSTDKKRFEKHVYEIILDIDRLVKGENKVYRNCYSCDSPYECEFLDACASNSFAGYQQKEKIFSELDDCEY